MKVTVEFGEPHDVTPGGFDGTKIAFPFKAVEHKIGALADIEIESRVITSISGTRSAIWGFGRIGEEVTEIAPTLFEYARERLIQVLIGSELENHKSVIAEVTDHGKYPFDRSKLTDPNGARYEFDIDALKENERLAKKGPIGF